MDKLKYFGFIGCAAMLAACSSLGKMQKCMVDVKFKATPNPQEAKGGEVATAIQIDFPTRYFDKKVLWELTPTAVFNGQEKAYTPFYVQGEKFAGNNKEVSFKKGGSASYTGSIPFVQGMDVSTLELRIKGSKGLKTKNYDRIKLADGTITTPYLLENDYQAIPAPHRFERIRTLKQQASINFLVNSDNVRASEIVDADMNAMKALLAKMAKNTSYTLKSITIEAYASPEGELRKNENLAKGRAEAAQTALSAQFKAVKLTEDKTLYTLSPKGEDWQGFKEMMEKSKIADKELILRILTMYTDVTKREEEIRNLSATFTEVSEQILPKLRRALITLNYELVGKSDADIKKLALSKPADLDADELNYAATLYTSNDDKLKIYKSAEQIYTDDARGAANTGYILFVTGQNDAALSKLQDASAKGDLSASNNLGVISAKAGDLDKASSYFEKSKGEFSEAAYNLGQIKVVKGDYAAASQLVAETKTFNAALAHCLNANYDKANSALANSATKNSAKSNYLAGIVAARAGKQEVMIERLTEAVKLDSAYKNKVKNDAEFIKYRDNNAFKALVK